MVRTAVSVIIGVFLGGILIAALVILGAADSAKDDARAALGSAEQAARTS